MNAETAKILRAKLLQGLFSAKTEADLEALSDMADHLVLAGVMTQREVDALWGDFAPSPYVEN